MYCVIITAPGNDSFFPFEVTAKSLSFLPLGKNRNILSHIYSMMNTAFTSDKIFILCTGSQYEEVLNTNISISEEHILIEPESISFSASVYYASLATARYTQEESVFYIRADKIFKPGARINDWLSASGAVSSLGKIVFPLLYIERDNKPVQGDFPFIEAGKIAMNERKHEFYYIDQYNQEGNPTKKRKVFGKQGKIVYSIFASGSSLKNISRLSANIFYRELLKVFSVPQVLWKDIKNVYSQLARLGRDVNIYECSETGLCLFVDSFSVSIEKFTDLLTAADTASNFTAGAVNDKNCTNCVLLNNNDTPIECRGLKNMLVIADKANFYTENLGSD